MWWEIWFARPRRPPDVQRLLFETERAARAALDRLVWTCVLFGPDSRIVQEKRGVLDFGSSGLGGILTERQRRCVQSADQQRWAVGVHIFGGVQFEVLPDEASARARYGAVSRSKVLFAPNGTPVEFSSMPSDAQGVGVATILKLCGDSDYADLPVGDALATGAAPFVPPGKRRLVRGALRPVVERLFTRSSVAFFASGPYRNRSLCYFDIAQFPGIRGHVALTIDDAPCRLGRANSMIPQVQALLRKHRARATFMLVGSFASGHEEDLASLLREGHELGNHGWLDRAYHEDSAEAFARDVEACSAVIRSIERDAGVEETVRWFRAPHGKYTEAMEAVLLVKGLTNVMCDAYACCPVIQDGAFIGESLTRQADHGSILLIHMPERGFREWCLQGLERLLEGLQRRGFRVVTVSELTRRAAGAEAPSTLAGSL